MNDKKDFENKTTSIHTLESDLASAVRDENYGKNIIKIVTDQNKNFAIPTIVGNSVVSNWNIKYIFTKKNVLIFFIAAILMGAGGTIVYILYKAKHVQVKDDVVQAEATTTSTVAAKPLIKNSDILNPEIIQSADFSGLNRFEIITGINKIKDLLLTKKIAPGNNISIGTNLTVVHFFEKIRYSSSVSKYGIQNGLHFN